MEEKRSGEEGGAASPTSSDRRSSLSISTREPVGDHPRVYTPHILSSSLLFAFSIPDLSLSSSLHSLTFPTQPLTTDLTDLSPPFLLSVRSLHLFLNFSLLKGAPLSSLWALLNAHRPPRSAPGPVVGKKYFAGGQNCCLLLGSFLDVNPAAELSTCEEYRSVFSDLPQFNLSRLGPSEVLNCSA